MLPGYVSGFYGYDECHIDLSRLAAFARARLIHGEACGVDTKARRVVLAGRPPVRYDALSIDVGITPSASTVPGAAQHTVPVKPIDRCVGRVCVRVLQLAPARNSSVSASLSRHRPLPLFALASTPTNQPTNQPNQPNQPQNTAKQLCRAL
jgi:hypothetical protein